MSKRKPKKKEAESPDQVAPKESVNVSQDILNRELLSVLKGGYSLGSLPPPDMLKEFNEVIPDGAERIFDHVESEQYHRQEMDKMLVKLPHRRLVIGQWMGYSIAIIALIGAFACVFNDKDIPAALFGAMGVAQIIASLLKSKTTDK